MINSPCIITHFVYSIYRKPEDWTLNWPGSGSIFGWGHNHRGQLGGPEGAKVKIPVPCYSLAALKPVDLIGGEQTLFAITAEGKVYYFIIKFRIFHHFKPCSVKFIAQLHTGKFISKQFNNLTPSGKF